MATSGNKDDEGKIPATKAHNMMKRDAMHRLCLPRPESLASFAATATPATTYADLLSKNPIPSTSSGAAIGCHFHRRSSCHKTKGTDFNLSELAKATEPVENSISFPVIEWSSDTDSGNDQDEENHGSLSFIGAAPLTGFDSEDEDSLAHLAPVSVNRACGSHLHRSRRRGSRLCVLSGLLSGPSSAPTLNSERVDPSIGSLGKRQKLGGWGQFTETEEGRMSPFRNSPRAAYKKRQRSERHTRLSFTSSPYLLPRFVPKG